MSCKHSLYKDHAGLLKSSGDKSTASLKQSFTSLPLNRTPPIEPRPLLPYMEYIVSGFRTYPFKMAPSGRRTSRRSVGGLSVPILCLAKVYPKHHTITTMTTEGTWQYLQTKCYTIYLLAAVIPQVYFT